jgi:hypothetical protein
VRALTFHRVETPEWWSHAYRIDAGELWYCVRKINSVYDPHYVAYRVIREPHRWSETRKSLGSKDKLADARALCLADEESGAWRDPAA